MLVLSKQLSSMLVGSLRLGKAVAEIDKLIVNPHDLSISAFQCRGKKYRDEKYILTTQDIREIRRNLVFIDSKEEIVPLEEVIRVRKIAELEFELIGKRVRTESGKKLGKVEDYVINTLNFKIEKVHVQRPFLRSLSTSSLIIHRNQIVEVNDREVIVNDAVVEDEGEETVPARATSAV